MYKIVSFWITPVTQLFMLFMGIHFGIELAEYKQLQKQADECAAYMITVDECVPKTE